MFVGYYSAIIGIDYSFGCVNSVPTYMIIIKSRYKVIQIESWELCKPIPFIYFIKSGSVSLC